MQVFISKQNQDFILNDYYGITNCQQQQMRENKKYKLINFDIVNLSLSYGTDGVEIKLRGDFDQDILKFLLYFNLSIEIVIEPCNTQQEIVAYKYNNCRVSKNTIENNGNIIYLHSQNLYNDNISEYISATCMANFCDSKCGLDVNNFTKSGSVSKVVSDYAFQDNARTEDDLAFKFASLTFTSGQNKGITYDVKNVSGGVVNLLQLVKYAIVVGDTYVIKRSCNKTYSACKVFNNQLNFRGF